MPTLEIPHWHSRPSLINSTFTNPCPVLFVVGNLAIDMHVYDMGLLQASQFCHWTNLSARFNRVGCESLFLVFGLAELYCYNAAHVLCM